jgi:hypothetical protein
VSALAGRAWQAALAAAVAAHALGWVLPVARDYRGWQAFRVAFSPVWPFEGFRIEPGLLLVLSVASALTNVVFAVLALALVGGGRTRVVLYGALAAGVLDLHWPVSMGSQRTALESGYVVWLVSFGCLALAAHLRARAEGRIKSNDS